MSGELPGTSTERTPVTGLAEPRDFPLLFEAAETISGKGQRDTRQMTRWELILAIVGAVSGTISWRVGQGDLDIWAGVGTMAFLLAGLTSVVHANRNPEARWYRGRAAAESVKTLTWLYAVGGTPFPAGDSGADDRLLTRLGELVDSLKELDQVVPADSSRRQITPAMTGLRARPLADRRQAYIEGRVNDQIAWYSKRAADYTRSAQRWLVVVAAANACGAVAGFLRMVDVLQLDLLGLAATVAGAATAWTQLLQHKALANSYAVAVQDLTLIRDRIPSVADDAWPRFVGDAEEAVSREHTMWLARRGLAAGTGNLRRS